MAKIFIVKSSAFVSGAAGRFVRSYHAISGAKLALENAKKRVASAENRLKRELEERDKAEKEVIGG